MPTAAAAAAMSSCQRARERFGQPSKLWRPGILSRVPIASLPSDATRLLPRRPVLCRTLPAGMLRVSRRAGTQDARDTYELRFLGFATSLA